MLPEKKRERERERDRDRGKKKEFVSQINHNLHKDSHICYVISTLEQGKYSHPNVKDESMATH